MITWENKARFEIAHLFSANSWVKIFYTLCSALTQYYTADEFMMILDMACCSALCRVQ